MTVFCACSPVTSEPGWAEKQQILSSLNSSLSSGGLHLLASARNNTPATDWLFYNRLPRSGGKTLVALLQALGTDLDYQHQEHVYRTPWKRWPLISNPNKYKRYILFQWKKLLWNTVIAMVLGWLDSAIRRRKRACDDVTASQILVVLQCCIWLLAEMPSSRIKDRITGYDDLA